MILSLNKKTNMKLLIITGISAFEKDIKGSKAVLIKNVGHVPMEEAPQQTATLINTFIK